MCNQESRRLTCVHEDEDDSVQPPRESESFIMRVRRKIKKVPVFLLAMVVTSVFHAGHSVWSFNIPHQAYIVGVKIGYCENLAGLTEKQRSIVCGEQNQQLRTSVGKGAKLALEECRFQFQYRRWNCSLPSVDQPSFIPRITRQSTREAAFTYAITSAGVMWMSSRACTEGNLSECRCSSEGRPEDLKKEYLWGGCNADDIQRGGNASKLFMDAGEEHNPSSRKHAKTLMNLHNNKIGRMVVRELSTIECKCHGVSGSCNMKTCWRELSEFREVGNALHDRYDDAIFVKLKRQNGRAILSPKKKRRAFRRQLPSTENKLVFLEPSPNFCFRNLALGVPGVRGRKCIKDSPSTDGCGLLCCSKGHNTRVVTSPKQCSCKFYWCCKVKCKTCLRNETIHTCK